MSDLAERAATVAQVLVDDLDAMQVSDSDLHHLSRVLRVRDGELVSTTNGRGAWRICRWKSGSLVPSTDVRIAQQSPRAITVGFALTKGDKPEWVVQKLTEIGVDVILPIASQRSVVKWDAEKATKNIERLRRVAVEASMQSRRVWLPEVRELTAFANVENKVLANAGGDAITANDTTVLVGPEGGWSDEELESAASIVDLGNTILRAETAALAAAVHLCGRWQKG